MAIAAESRTSAEIVRGSLVYWVPDGTTYGTEPQESSRTNVPTFEEAISTGLCLGMLQKFKWGTEYKTLTKLGYDPAITRYNFCTNGSHYAGEAGVKTFGLGPSRENLAHTINEYIEIDQLVKVCDCYTGVMKALLK